MTSAGRDGLPPSPVLPERATWGFRAFFTVNRCPATGGTDTATLNITLDDDNDTKADDHGFYSGESVVGNQPEPVIVYQ